MKRGDFFRGGLPWKMRCATPPSGSCALSTENIYVLVIPYALAAWSASLQSPPSWARCISITRYILGTR